MATGMFDATIQKTHFWLNELAQELDWDDRHRALTALRVTLAALRDRLSLEEVAQLGAQLPLVVRGLYYEGWDPSGKPLKERRKAQFLAPIAHAFREDPFADPEAVAV